MIRHLVKPFRPYRYKDSLTGYRYAIRCQEPIRRIGMDCMAPSDPVCLLYLVSTPELL